MRVLAVMFLLAFGATEVVAQNMEYTKSFLDPLESVLGAPVWVADVGLAIVNGSVWLGALAVPDVSDIAVEIHRVIPGKEPPWRLYANIDLMCTTFSGPQPAWMGEITSLEPCIYPFQKVPRKPLYTGTYSFRISFTHKGKPFSWLIPNISVVVLDGSR